MSAEFSPYCRRSDDDSFTVVKGSVEVHIPAPIAARSELLQGDLVACGDEVALPVLSTLQSWLRAASVLQALGASCLCSIDTPTLGEALTVTSFTFLAGLYRKDSCITERCDSCRRPTSLSTMRP